MENAEKSLSDIAILSILNAILDRIKEIHFLSEQIELQENLSKRESRRKTKLESACIRRCWFKQVEKAQMLNFSIIWNKTNKQIIQRLPEFEQIVNWGEGWFDNCKDNKERLNLTSNTQILLSKLIKRVKATLNKKAKKQKYKQQNISQTDATEIIRQPDKNI